MATAAIKEEYRDRHDAKDSLFGRVANIDEDTWELEFWVMEEGWKSPEKLMLPLAHLSSCVEAGTGSTPHVDYFELARDRGWHG